MLTLEVWCLWYFVKGVNTFLACELTGNHSSITKQGNIIRNSSLIEDWGISLGNISENTLVAYKRSYNIKFNRLTCPAVNKAISNMFHSWFFIRCASISWFQVVSEWVSYRFQLAHLRVFQIIFVYLCNFMYLRIFFAIINYLRCAHCNVMQVKHQARMIMACRG